MQGWHLLRQCGLTREQKQLVNLRAPTLELTKVTEALYLILGQDYKQSTLGHPERRWQRGKGGRAYAAEDDYDMEDWEDYDDAYWHYGEDFNPDEVYDPEYDYTGDFEAEFGY